MAQLIKDKNGNYQVISVWYIEDIHSAQDFRNGKPLTTEQGNLVMEFLAHNFDASIGINWEVVEMAIDYVLESEGV